MSTTDQPFNCFKHHECKTQAPFTKLSEFLRERVPEIDLETAKKAIIAYREYMWTLRGDKDQRSNFCDICYKLISPEEAKQTTIYDYNYCCAEHGDFRANPNLDYIRKLLNIQVEHLPMIDIYG